MLESQTRETGRLKVSLSSRCGLNADVMDVEQQQRRQRDGGRVMNDARLSWEKRCLSSNKTKPYSLDISLRPPMRRSPHKKPRSRGEGLTREEEEVGPRGPQHRTPVTSFAAPQQR
ncbi:unnamed protein product [Lampetra planeri]